MSKDVTFLEDNFDHNPGLRLNGSIGSSQITTNEENESCPILAKICHGQNNQAQSSSVDSSQSSANLDDSSSPLDDSVHDMILLDNVDPPNISAQPMVTRAHSGITKPNMKYLQQISSGTAVPTGVKMALADPI